MNKWHWLAGAGVLLTGGTAYAMLRTKGPSGPPVEPPAVFTQEASSGSLSLKSLEPSVITSVSLSRPTVYGLATGTVKVRIKSPRVRILYDKSGWDKGGRLRSMYKDGELLSVSNSEKLIYLCETCNGSLRRQGDGEGVFVVSRGVPVPEPVGIQQTETQQPPHAEYKPETTGGSGFERKSAMDIKLPVGTYYIYPKLMEDLKWTFKPFTHYWKWGRRGPQDLDGRKEAFKKVKARQCASTITKVTLERVDSRELKKVVVEHNKSQTVTLQPIIEVTVSKKKYETTESKAWYYACKTMGTVSSVAYKLLCSYLGICFD